jgi:para-aminobenzoate synthetase component 1
MHPDLLIELPFSDDTEGYLRFVCAMPAAVALESGRPISEEGRFSIYSADPVATLHLGSASKDGVVSPLPLTELVSQIRGLHTKYFKVAEQTDSLSTLPFHGGLAGFVAYPRLGQGHEMQVASAYIGVYLWAIVVDHEVRSSWLAIHPQCSEPAKAALKSALVAGAAAIGSQSAPAQFTLQGDFAVQTPVNTYSQSFDSIKNYITSGDVYQVNLTQKFSAPCSGSALAAYLTLRDASPGPFNAFIDLGDEALLSLSPERLLLCEGGQLETKPIKGTRQRLADPAADKRQRDALVNSDKDRAENLMIVDLLRNDLGKVSKTGSVKVTELFALKSFTNVHHLVTTIRAQLAPNLDAIDALSACFPGGSITGAPKLRAMEIIAELEVSERGPYCGSVLYWDSAGRFDSNIAIRTLRWVAGASAQEPDHIECWAGGGVVADSACEEEYAECFHKVQNLLDALAQA